MCAVTWKWLATLSQPRTLLHIAIGEVRSKTRRELPKDTESSGKAQTIQSKGGSMDMEKMAPK